MMGDDSERRSESPWPTVDPAEAGWDVEALDEARALAQAHRSSGLSIVHRGRTVVEDVWPLERVTDTLLIEALPDGRTREDVASVQKSVTSVLLGIALGRSLFALDDSVSDLLGPGWSRADTGDEARIRVRHLMSMTSGLDDRMMTVAEPGERWDYNLGAGYHTLKRILEQVGGDGIDELSRDWLFDPLGMDETAWRTRDLEPGLADEVREMFTHPDGRPFEALVTTARDLARLGVALLGDESGGSALGLPETYRAEMFRTSTALNPSYGLLWWLNGQEFRLAPKVPEPEMGSMWPDAPADTVAALGALGRSLHVIPSRDLVVVRLGDEPGDGQMAGSRFGRELWRWLGRALPERLGG